MSLIFAQISSKLYRVVFVIVLLCQFFCKKTIAVNYVYPLLGHEINDSTLQHSNDIYEYLLQKNTFFNNNEVNNTGIGIVRKSKDQTLSFFLSVFVLGILAMGRWIFAPHMQNVNGIFSSLMNTPKSKTEENGFIISLFTMLYAATLTYLVYIIFIHIFTIHNNLYAFFIAFGSVLGYLFLKNLFSYIIAWTYNRNLLWVQAFWQNYQINKLITIVLIPICLLISIKDEKSIVWLLRFACLWLVIGVLLKVIKNTPIITNLFKDFKLNFILYLCALEIFPLAICIHWLIK